ncbi:MAG TPA: haloalkane dehalogenase, partial [Myxococcales bacterium]|nr:haloalkane dehalogenase [Myxococcales bacterium]
KDRFRGLVLANTAALVPRRPLRTSAFHRFSHLPGVSTLAFRGLGFPVPILSRLQGDPRSLGPAEIRAYGWPLRSWRLRAGPLAMARMVPDREGHPTLGVLDETDAFLRSYRGPAALVWGTRDPILGRAHHRLSEALPHATVELTEAGHFLQEEVPDRLAAAIERVASAA